MAREGELRSVGGIAGPGAPIRIDRLFRATVRGHGPQSLDSRERAVAARGGEDDPLAVGSPTHNVVGGVMEGKLARLSSGGGNHEYRSEEHTFELQSLRHL